MKFLNDVRKNKVRLLMVLPVVVFYIAFNYMPMFGLTIAFKNFSFSCGILGSPWAGLSNFEFLFKTADAWVITRNTILYNMTFLVLGMFLSSALAILFDMLGKNKYTQVCQSVSLFPYFISWVAGSYFVYAFLSPDKGFFNQILVAMGGDKIEWYSEPGRWPFILIFCQMWKTIGYDCIIYYATVKGFDGELYEAARIEGASWFQQIRYITFPLLKSILIIMGILKIGHIFQSDFGLFYMVTKNSGPLYSTTATIDTYVYNGMMNGGQMGMTAAAGFYQSVVGFVLVLLTNAVVRKVSPEDAMF